MKIYVCLLCLLLSACAFTPHTGQDLVGQDKKVVQKQLGKPIVSRTEAPYKIWSFRIQDCSLLVYFDQNDVVQHVDHSGYCP
ncbi:MAG: hypothetical protein SPL08_01415 [Pseudomonadota bacterium]|nr:hypothetical protein [Pseudomonadota bacterium]